MKMGRPAWSRLLAALVAATVLLSVLALYCRPEFLTMLADQLWACI